jgi:hypothetical protein
MSYRLLQRQFMKTATKFWNLHFSYNMTSRIEQVVMLTCFLRIGRKTGYLE